MIKLISKLFKGEKLVEMENPKNQFTVKFDPETQSFRKVVFNEETQKFEMGDLANTDAREVATKVCNIL